VVQPRDRRTVAHHCPCELPDLVETAPRLPDGTPFPTLYYMTCPRAAALIGGLEAAGSMREMTERLAGEHLKAAYDGAHHHYLARRDAAAVGAGVEPLPTGTQSAPALAGRLAAIRQTLDTPDCQRRPRQRRGAGIPTGQPSQRR
jgi:hypothetical protein